MNKFQQSEYDADMRLKKSRAAAEEELIALLNNGYQVLTDIKGDYRNKREAKTFDSDKDILGIDYPT